METMHQKHLRHRPRLFFRSVSGEGRRQIRPAATALYSDSGRSRRTVQRAPLTGRGRSFPVPTSGRNFRATSRLAAAQPRHEDQGGQCGIGRCLRAERESRKQRSVGRVIDPYEPVATRKSGRFQTKPPVHRSRLSLRLRGHESRSHRASGERDGVMSVRIKNSTIPTYQLESRITARCGALR
jgi:hypothetical protein